ncbi:hypothetical protein X947_5502 [Burkholderia pseudomallei MSHR7334]|nr:hypothetical protein X947_5502 [Burkholderia pseudomallei MSHR7334]
MRSLSADRGETVRSMRRFSRNRGRIQQKRTVVQFGGDPYGGHSRGRARPRVGMPPLLSSCPDNWGFGQPGPA